MILAAAFSALAGNVPAEPAPQGMVLCDAVRAQGNDAESDPLLRGTEGWIFRTADLDPPYDIDAGSLAALGRFVADWQSRGTAVAFVLLAPRGYFGAAHVDRTEPGAATFDREALGQHYAEAIRVLGTTGALVPNLIAAADADGVGEQYYFERDFHWRPEAAKSAMVALAKAAKESGLSFAPSAWKSTLEKERAHAGSLARRVEQECGVPAYPAEHFGRFVSTRVTVAPNGQPVAPAIGKPGAVRSAEGTRPPQVVLAGSSHTNKGGEDLMNTTGWMREAAATDVLNVGVDGGGYSTGLLRWMDTELSRAQPPKLLSVEMSSRVPTNVAAFMRMAIPTMYGDCTSPSATGRVTLSGQAAPLLYVPAGTRSGGTYVVLDVSDPALVQFAVSFTLTTGAEDFYHVQRSTLVSNQGRFYVEAPLVATGLAGIRVDGGPDSRATITSRLCALPADEAGVRSLVGLK